jgi:hypothetical protein
LKNIIRLIICLFVLITFIHSNENEEIRLLSQTMRAFDSTKSHEIWPNFKLQAIPTIVHYKNGHAYAFFFSGSPKNWKRLFIHQYPVQFSENRFALAQIPLHPAYQIEGKKAFVYGMEQCPEFTLFTLIHERFHLHQFRYFSNLSQKKGEYLDAQNVINLSLMELENKLLTRFLESKKKDQKIGYLKDFLAVASIRRPQLHPSSLEWEDHLQKMEGTADYVSLRTYQVFPIMKYFDAEQTLLKMRSKKVSPSLYQDVVKGRNYFVGTVICLALDFCQVKGWKNHVTAGTKSLHELLSESLPLTLQEQQIQLQRVMTEFDYDLIEAQMRDKLDEEKQQLRLLEESFKKQSGIAIRIGIPHQHSTSGGRHEKSYHFTDMKISMKETSTSISQDERWKLEFMTIPLIFESREGVRLFKIEEPTCRIDGKEVAIAEINQVKTFSTIQLKSPQCNLNASIPGKIYNSEQTIYIEFTKP